MTRRGGYEGGRKKARELTLTQLRAAIAKKTRDLRDLRTAYADARSSSQ
jgi:hypothetical protein